MATRVNRYQKQLLDEAPLLPFSATAGVVADRRFLKRQRTALKALDRLVDGHNIVIVSQDDLLKRPVHVKGVLDTVCELADLHGVAVEVVSRYELRFGNATCKEIDMESRPQDTKLYSAITDELGNIQLKD